MDILALPLSGTQLIEASAGTGKTWTIAALYLRLLVEGDLDVERILVLTFTKAATAELKDRIRRRLVAALEALKGAGEADPFLRGWLACVGRERAEARLLHALRAFDMAAIYTIHGFCQRVLNEYALESGVPFELDLMEDDSALRQQVADDFWRRELGEASVLWSAWLLARDMAPEDLLAPLGSVLGRTEAKILTSPDPGDCADRERAFLAVYGPAQTLWHREGPEVLAVLAGAMEAKALNGTSYKPPMLTGWATCLDDYFAADIRQAALFPVPDCLAKLRADALREKTNKKHVTPAHPFFEALQAVDDGARHLEDAFAARRAHLLLRLADTLRAELPRLKDRRRVQSYDDVLLSLRDALKRDDGTLAARLRDRHPAALIDEFQDTDPAQYEIFRRIYGAGGGPLFLVGDPKQAIYRFRDADIFVYLEAARAATERHSLAVNRRSAPRLVRAVNTLFGRSGSPFVLDGIPFHPVGSEEREGGLRIGGEDDAPLRFLLLPKAPKEGGVWNVGEAEPLIAHHVAAEIGRLLDWGRRGEALLDGRPLGGGDMAVLVVSHQQGRLVQEALRRLGIGSARQGQENVFHSGEAEELERVLLAISEPGRPPLLRAALATELWGLDAASLSALNTDEAGWEARWEAAEGYRRQWEAEGFMPMFRRWLHTEGVPERLLAKVDGERRLTNLLHVAELLHGEERQGNRGREALLQWFSRQRREDGEGEARLLRLESDEDLVQIVTVHRAKGLQYPIVFCPYLWKGMEGRKGKDGPVLCHDPADPAVSLADFGSPRREELEIAARRETFAEGLRLLYVALTRAQWRCFLYGGLVTGADRSPIAWLLRGPVAHRFPEDLEGGMPDWGQAAAEVAAEAGGSIAVTVLPEAVVNPLPIEGSGEGPALAARRFSRTLAPAWRVTSFTALVAGRGAESPDHDAWAVAETGTELEGAAAFPRGARAGTCLHAILAEWDPAGGRDTLEPLAKRRLREHGFGAQWLPSVLDWLTACTAVPLWAGGPALRDLPRDHCLHELEFYYPVRSLRLPALRELLAAAGAEGMSLAEGAALEGYMKGYIDLVFEHDGRYYLADYKSNDLGPPAAYRRGSLAAVMAREGYTLQYLIYALALHRLLRLRLTDYDYDRHFGGVLYLFLRGMAPGRGPESGIFEVRPPLALVEALDRIMGGRP